MIDNYRTLCTRFYDLDHPCPPAAELACYRDLLRGVAGRILEPMCGSGRFLVPLLSLGYDIHGFDGSVDMIEACRKRLGGDERVQLATFESFNSPHTFQACIIPAGSFSLLADVTSATQALECIHRVLAPDGVCHIEVCDRPRDGSGATGVNSRTVETPDGTALTVIEMTTYDEQSGVETSHCHYVECALQDIVAFESELYPLRRYDIPEFAALAEANGFTVANHVRNAFDDDRSIFTLTPNQAGSRAA